MSQSRLRGIGAALASALFLGLAPVYGKEAINRGLPPLGVVALRTSFAALLLLLVMVIFKRQYLYIYPAGLLGCFLAGTINGLGSLLYYSALGRIDASVGQLLYSLYPIFVMFWLVLDHQRPGLLTLFRLLLILPALWLLTLGNHHRIDLLGVLMMLGASLLYALHLPINQRVLFDMPSPTVTLYTLLAMSGVVIPAYFLSGAKIFPSIQYGWMPVLGLTIVTFLSRLALFMGVKFLGGLQTALLGLSELLVTLIFSYVYLGERLSQAQWAGALLLIISLSLVVQERGPRKSYRSGWLQWLENPKAPKDLPLP